MSDPILIWGAGAIGGALGAAFARAGEDVLFVDAAGDHVDALNADGLTITGPVAPGHVAARAARPDAVRGRFRRCVLAVKAHHTAAAAAALAPHVAADGFVISAQNGLNEPVIAGAVGRDRTMGCFLNFGADYVAPGTVLYGGRGAVVLGEVDGRMTARLADTHRLFQGFDPAAVATPNVFGYLWSKMIYGALLFGTALTNDGIADVLATEGFRPVLTRLAHEVVAVSRAEGVALEPFDGFEPAAFLPEAPASRTAASYDAMVAHNRRSAKSHSGIWRDLAVRRRPTEVDAQLGPVVTLGRAHGIATPVTAAVIARIHDIEHGRRPLDRANLAELSNPEATA